MKLLVEIEVRDDDADAVAHALGLFPKDGCFWIEAGRVLARCAIMKRMKIEAADIINNARELRKYMKVVP